MPVTNTARSGRLAIAATAVFLLAHVDLCVAQDLEPDQAPPTSPALGTVPGGALPSSPVFPVPSSGPQTFEERLMDYSVDTFGPRALLAPSFGAAINMMWPPKSYPREWRSGAQAFGRNYGSRLATRTSERTARFVVAAVLHEDFRYRPSTRTNPLARAAHALAFTFVDRSDRGGNRIAFSNFAASAASGFTPNLYLPAGYATVSRAETRMAITFGGLVARNLAQEFGPELARLARKLHLPAGQLPIPEWWTPRR